MQTKIILIKACVIIAIMVLAFNGLSAQSTVAFGTPGMQTGVSRANPDNPTNGGFFEYLPLDYDESSGNQYPLIIWLHGKGQAGNGHLEGETYVRGSIEQPGNLNDVLGNGIAKVFADNMDDNTNNDFHVDGAIIISPQKFSESGEGLWGLDEMEALMTQLSSYYPVDVNRIYLTGFSGGGNVLGQYLKDYQSQGQLDQILPAAIVPVGITAHDLAKGRFRYLESTSLGLWYQAYRGDTNYAHDRGKSSLNNVSGVNTLPDDADASIANDDIAHFRFVNGEWVKTTEINIEGETPGSIANLMFTSHEGGGHNAPTYDLYEQPEFYEWILSFERTYQPMLSNVDLGDDITITLPNNTVSLDAIVEPSTPDGSIVKYEWYNIAGGGYAISDASVPNPTITNLTERTYTFGIVAIDDQGIHGFDEINVTVLPDNGNPPPVADAGADQTLLFPTDNTVLDGSNSSDDVAIQTYSWELTSGPTTVVISTPSEAVTNVSGLSEIGEYQFTLTVGDNEGLESSDQVVVTVTSESNEAPVANAGADQVVVTNSTVTLDGSASTDDYGIASYQWESLTVPVNELVPGETIYVNFTNTDAADQADSPWNNFTTFPQGDNVGMPLENLVDENDQPTSVSVQFQEGWYGLLARGYETGDDSGIFPDDVIRYFYYFDKVDDGSNTRTITLSGLSTDKIYSLSFFNSADIGGDGKYVTRYTVNGQYQDLDPYQNTDEAVTLENLVPSTDGELNIEVTPPSTISGAAASISALVIQSFVPSEVQLFGENEAIASVTGLEVGEYEFQLTVTDQEDEESSDVVTVTVVDENAEENESIQINFTLSGTSAGAGWNETDGTINAGYRIEDLTNTLGLSSGIGMELIDGWSGRKVGGKLAAEGEEGIFPNEVRDAVYFFAKSTENTSVDMKFDGLSIGSSYSFTFLSSRTGSDDKTSIFSSNGLSDAVDAANNTADYAILENLTPDENGEILIEVSVGDNASYAYLNGIIIQASSSNELVANAGPDQQIILSDEPIVLDGTSSSTGNGDVSYIWEYVSGPIDNVSITAVDQAETQVTGLSVAGEYEFRLTISNEEGEQSTDTVSITVSEPSPETAQTIQINFTLPGVTSGTLWNETDGTVNAGYVLQNLTTTSGESSGINMEFLDQWSGRKVGGKLADDSEVGVFPNEVREAVYFFTKSEEKPALELKFDGLNASSSYAFTFLSSRTGGDDKTSIFSSSGISDEVNAANNISDYAVLENLVPDADGEIVIALSVGENATYAYLNGIIIEAIPNNNGRTSFEARSENSLTDNVRMLVYPNPSNGLFYYGDLGEVSSVEVIDMGGRTLKVIVPSEEQYIDLRDLVMGSYMLLFNTENGIETAKVVIKE